MEAAGSALPSDEFVGRRLRNGASPAHFVDDDEGVRVLVGAFIEARLDTHLSVDRLWVGVQPGEAKLDRKIAQIASCAREEGWGDTKGWAAARVDDYIKISVLRGGVATAKESNPYHADLLKEDFLIVTAADERREAKKKSQTLAHVLSDHFNTLLKQKRARILAFPP